MEEKEFVRAIRPLEEPKEETKFKRALIIDVPTKHFEDKTYIILYQIKNEEDKLYRQLFAIRKGRTQAISDIRDKLQSGVDIDIHKSVIITETKQTETDTGNTKYYLIPLEESISVYSFWKSVEEYYGLDYFDIEEYNEGFEYDNEEDSTNSISSSENRVFDEMTMEYKRMLSDAKMKKSIDNFTYDKSKLEGPNV